MNRIFLLGAGGHARVVLESLRLAEPGVTVEVLDDDPAKWGGTMLGAPVSGGRDTLLAAPGARVMPAIGDNHQRLAAIEWLENSGFVVATTIDPRAILSVSATLGPGAFLAPGAIVNAGAALGRGVIVNTGASIDHDCVLADGVHIGPGARLCGGVRIGLRTLIGVGAVAVPLRTIGDDCVIGAGAAVTSDIHSGARATGVPARIKE
ncbi:acetyltransferase [Sphingomonas hylomeconis]|uniref:Acetyltransferase n=1 Tax=Sphingomonas hylomeconis TaxID=1395958 RepID=A0ABV7STK8_9SPHN|nr:acetyltransferase [Sphingomonas hylomeconis]